MGTAAGLREVRLATRCTAVAPAVRATALWGMVMLRVLPVVFLMFCGAGVCMGQQGACTVVASVVKGLPSHPLRPMTLPKGAFGSPPALWVPARGLSPAAFTVRDGHHRVAVLSVEADAGPRLIVFVVVLDKEWATAEHGGLADTPGIAVKAILSEARPEDSFALVKVGGQRLAVPFGSSPTALLASIKRLSPSRTQVVRGDDVVAALLEAATWFGTPQAGDAIIFIGDVFRNWSRARASKARTALVSRGIRLFSLGGGINVGTCFNCGYSLSPGAALAEATGGAWQGIGYQGPEAGDENRWLWQNEAKSVYDMATSGYILRLPETGPHMRIELAPGVVAGLNYPTPLPVCP